MGYVDGTHMQLKNYQHGWDPLFDPSSNFDPNFTPPLGMEGTDCFSMLSSQGMTTPPLSAPPDRGSNTFGHLEHFDGNCQRLGANAHSVLSLSDESLTSCEDLSSVEVGGDIFPGYTMPSSENFAPDFDELIRAEGLSA